MAGVAFVVVELRTAGVVHSGGEIDIVMASAAGRASRIGEISLFLHCLRCLRMANHATPWIAGIRRECNGRIIKGPKLVHCGYIRSARLHAGQILAHMERSEE